LAGERRPLPVGLINLRVVVGRSGAGRSEDLYAKLIGARLKFLYAGNPRRGSPGANWTMDLIGLTDPLSWSSDPRGSPQEPSSSSKTGASGEREWKDVAKRALDLLIADCLVVIPRKREPGGGPALNGQPPVRGRGGSGPPLRGGVTGEELSSTHSAMFWGGGGGAFR